MKYLESNSDFEFNSFDDGELLITLDTFTYGNTTINSGDTVASLTDIDSTAIGAAVGITTGVYFIRGTFVTVDKDTLVVSPYSNNPSYRVGLQIKEEIVIEKVPEVVFEEPKTMSLNDRLTKGINIGLNDRIAFEKKLFGGSSDDFNRVLSQLNTFDSFDEAQGFINDFVKPDYNNWDGKEEFENRFLEIVEKKFN